MFCFFFILTVWPLERNQVQALGEGILSCICPVTLTWTWSWMFLSGGTHLLIWLLISSLLCADVAIPSRYFRMHLQWSWILIIFPLKPATFFFPPSFLPSLPSFSSLLQKLVASETWHCHWVTLVKMLNLCELWFPFFLVFGPASGLQTSAPCRGSVDF